jgi:protein tyrosine phosphatase (PTP) superfamily phosphohydrolase (DUF442 family)
MKKEMFTAVLACCLAMTVLAQQPGAPGIQNFMRINTEFCSGGQPTLAQLGELKSQGVNTVLSLRVPGEAGFDATAEEGEAKKLGMKFFNIPVSNQAPKDEQVDEFLKITDNAQNRPVFIHCGVLHDPAGAARWNDVRRCQGGSRQDRAAFSRIGGLCEAIHRQAQEVRVFATSTGTRSKSFRYAGAIRTTVVEPRSGAS